MCELLFVIILDVIIATVRNKSGNKRLLMTPRQKLRLPHNCYIILTSKCNLRCLHCYGNYGVSTPPKELTGKQWGKVFKQLADKGVFYLNISGGEPTCHPDFNEIIESLIENRLYFMLTTNGLCSISTLNTILKAKDYLLGINISLDGPDYISHGFIRKGLNGKSSESMFQKTLASIKFLVKNKVRTSISTCIHKENVKIMNKMADLIISIRPSNWSLSTISISGRAQVNSSIFASESNLSLTFWKKLRRKCERNDISVDFVDMPSIEKSQKNKRIYYKCPAARWFCEINSDGITTPCPLTRVNPPSKEIKFENILTKSIIEIWNGNAFNEFRSYQTRGCEGCNVKNKCDRCPPQSVQWFGDPLMPTPYCIDNGKTLGLKKLNNLKKRLKEAMVASSRNTYI
jgi:MoaA/NifB/PqqE/SkfB family radical SAM enzyme